MKSLALTLGLACSIFSGAAFSAESPSTIDGVFGKGFIPASGKNSIQFDVKCEPDTLVRVGDTTTVTIRVSPAPIKTRNLSFGVDGIYKKANCTVSETKPITLMKPWAQFQIRVTDLEQNADLALRIFYDAVQGPTTTAKILHLRRRESGVKLPSTH